MSTASRPDGPDTETLLRRVMEMLASTRTLPLSSSVKLDNKDEVLELLEEAVLRLPEEFRQARWMLKEREEFVGKMEREGEHIVEAARQRSEHMGQRAEIVREANHTARRLVEDAREESRRLRLEAEDYCDQKLAAFEIVLERTAKTVAAGRRKLSIPTTTNLASNPLASHSLASSDASGAVIAGTDPSDDTLAGQEAFFDQDRGE